MVSPEVGSMTPCCRAALATLGRGHASLRVRCWGDMSGGFLFLIQSHKSVARLTGVALRIKPCHTNLQKSDELQFEDMVIV